jgi:hypothetical protein
MSVCKKPCAYSHLEAHVEPIGDPALKQLFWCLACRHQVGAARSMKELTLFDVVIVDIQKELPLANNKNPNQKQPGEKEPGTFHYNPGNMSGKTIGKDESEQQAGNKEQSRHEQQDERRR